MLHHILEDSFLREQNKGYHLKNPWRHVLVVEGVASCSRQNTDTGKQLYCTVQQSPAGPFIFKVLEEGKEGKSWKERWWQPLVEENHWGHPWTWLHCGWVRGQWRHTGIRQKSGGKLCPFRSEAHGLILIWKQQQRETIVVFWFCMRNIEGQQH